MIINLPKLGPVQFKDDLTPEQFQKQLSALSEKYGFELPRPEYGVMESGIRGVKRGLSRMGSLATDIVPALVGSAFGQEEYARQQLEEAAQKEAQLQQENPAGFTSYKQIEGPLDFLKYGAESVGETLPDIAGIIGTGGVGGALGKRAAVKGAEELAERIGKKEALSKVLPGGVSAERAAELEATALRRAAPAIEKQKALGQAAGIYLGSYATNTPDVFQSIYEQTGGELAPGASLLFGGAVAALDAVLPGQLLKSMTQTEKLTIAEKILEKSGMQPSLLRKATALIPTTAAKEGLTEGAQEVITAMAEKFVDENQDIWDSEHFNRYLESAVRGAVAGAPFGGVQAVGERLGERSRERQKEYEEYKKQVEAEQPREPQQLDLFRPGEITPPSPGLTFPSTKPLVEEPEPVTARTEYATGKKKKKDFGQPYEVLSNAIPGQIEMFEPEAKGNKPLQPTPEADVQALAKKLEEETKRKVAEGKADTQALKEVIAELAPKDIDLLDYARRTGITSTPLFQLVQQATQIPERKLPKGKAPKLVKETISAEEQPAVPTAPTTLLTAEKLKSVGLSPLSGFYRRLVGKDVLDDEEVVRAEIEKAKLNPNISASTIKGLEAIETELPLQLTHPEVPKEVKEEAAIQKPETLEVTPEGQGQLFSRVGRDFKGMPKEELEANAPVFAEQLSNELRSGIVDKAEVLDKVRGLFDALDDADLLTQDERRAFYAIDKTLPITQTQKPGVKRSNEMLYLDLINMLNIEREKIAALGLGRPRVREDIKEELEQYGQAEPTTTEEPFTEEGEQEVVEDPKDVWDKLTAGMGVPYDSLNEDGKEMWTAAVEGGYANLHVANELFKNFGVAEKPAPKKKKKEEPADIGEREATEIEVSSLQKAKERVGEELSKLANSIGAKNNLTPEEQGSLSNFMSALGDLMYELIKSGVKTFAEALPLAKKKAKEQLGDLEKHVPETAYKQAFDGVSKQKVSPKQERKTAKERFDSVVNAPYNTLPPATQPIVQGALNSLSNLPGNLRQAALGFMTMDQIFEVYGKIMPSIKKLINALEVRASDVAKRREFVEKNLKKYHDVFKKYSAAQKDKFFRTFFDTTLDQIEPLTVTVKETIDSNGQVRRQRTYSLTPNPETAGNPITKAFFAMPKDVQEVYLDMRREYDSYADALEDLITKDVTPGTAKKLRTQFELKRLKVYLPLFRQGNFWLSYTDSAGEPVVMAFETERERQLEKQRAASQKAKDIKEFARFEDIISRTGQPPVGFVGKVIETLKEQKVPQAVLDQVYSSYLSLFPAESVRQMYRKRKGVEGFETDAVEVYANVMSRMVNQVGNLTHAKDIDSAMNGIIAEGDTNGSMAARDVAQNIAAQTQYLMNPAPNKWSARASSFSYYMYIAGNVSSALINLTQLPIVVYGLLGGEYGFNDAYQAMKSATSMYLNGAKDDNSTFLPDWTFGKNKNLRSDLKRLYDEAVKHSVIRRSTAHEIVDMRKQKAGDYVGLRGKVETGLSWVFQNSERANREITLIAAYELARKKGMSEQAAIQKAMDMVKAAHGSALSETGPRYFQGNFNRVIFTFKRFAQSQIYLLQKLFTQAFRDADPEVRAMARKQLIGIYGMSFLFAGAQGVPLYGAATMLAGFLMGDDDEPVDVEGYVNEAVGDMIYKGPINQLLNIDIASRTGFNGMVWRDNPKRLAEVGPVTYMLEQLAGPSYSAALNVQKGLGMISDGEAYRGFETMLPGAAKNFFKGLRFGIYGATNRDGVPIVEDVSLYNAVMQIGGMAPADLTEAYARAGAKKRVEKSIFERRVSLLDKYYLARREGDVDGAREIREEMREFSRKNPERNVRIDEDTIARSYRGHQQREREMVDGVHLNKALKRRLDEEYGTAEED